MAEGRRKGSERRESVPDSAPHRGAKRRPSRLPRVVYWSLVLGLWLVIAAAGTMVWVAHHGLGRGQPAADPVA
jgi:hypothetical protein